MVSGDSRSLKTVSSGNSFSKSGGIMKVTFALSYKEVAFKS